MTANLNVYLTVLSILILLGAILLLGQKRSHDNADFKGRFREKQVLTLTTGGVLLFDVIYCAVAVGIIHEYSEFYLSTATIVITSCALLIATWVVRRCVNVLSLYSRFQQESVTDPLTGLDNRRSLEYRLREEVARATRYRTALSILVLDIDHFKAVNDTHGHAAGDRVLVEIGKMLKEAMRDTDFCARVGGEEFIILVPNTEINGALLLGERLRHMTESLVVDIGVRERVTLTASIGISSIAAGERDSKQMLERADKAMYEAKRDGRNRVRARLVAGLDILPEIVGMAA